MMNKNVREIDAVVRVVFFWSERAVSYHLYVTCEVKRDTVETARSACYSLSNVFSFVESRLMFVALVCIVLYEQPMNRTRRRFSFVC